MLIKRGQLTESSVSSLQGRGGGGEGGEKFQREGARAGEHSSLPKIV